MIKWKKKDPMVARLTITVYTYDYKTKNKTIIGQTNIPIEPPPLHAKVSVVTDIHVDGVVVSSIESTVIDAAFPPVGVDLKSGLQKLVESLKKFEDLTAELDELEEFAEQVEKFDGVTGFDEHDPPSTPKGGNTPTDVKWDEPGDILDN